MKKSLFGAENVVCHAILYSAVNDPEPQMIPDVDRN